MSGAPADLGFRVLLVDDDADIRVLVAHVLRRAGWTVSCCATATEALELLAHTEVDLALLDVALGSTDGRDLAARVRATPGGRALPIVLLTGSAPAGAEPDLEVVCKPFNPRTLPIVLRQIIERARERR